MKNNKSLGQHWLKNRAILDEIAELSGEGGLCVEIGPGLGTLTASLLRRFDKVLAIEFDAKLAENLPKSFPGKNLEVVNVDFLKYDLDSIEAPYVIAGNIPYYITSPIIEKILKTKNLPKRVVLLMQKEVAERIVSEKESVLSLMVKNRAEVELGPVVLRDEFTPPPKVDSQVLIMEPKASEVGDDVFKLIKMGFSSPRKKVAHNIATLKSKSEILEIFEKVGINADARPADLNLEDWQNLFNEPK